MLKILALAISLVLAIGAAGCSKDNTISKGNQPILGSVSQPQSKQVNQHKNQTSTGSTTTIVAKSGNVVSDSDKQALLNEVDKEMDSLVSNINNLLDVEDSDLNLSE